MNVTGGVVCLYGNPNTGTVVVQLSSGDILNWNGTEATEQSLPLSPRLLGDSRTPLRLAQPCGKIELTLFNGKVCNIVLHSFTHAFFCLFIHSTVAVVVIEIRT